jgi:hypothetical protein
VTGPRPAGAPWTAGDDQQLMAMAAADTEKRMIARKLKRTEAAIASRLGKLRKVTRQRQARAGLKLACVSRARRSPS